MGEELLTLVQPALEEKHLHSRPAYLAGLRFSEEPEPIDVSKESRMLQMLGEVRNGIATLAAVTRLQRLSDDALVAAAEHSLKGGDYLSLGVALEESENRGGLAKLRITELTDTLDFPEIRQAEESFRLFEDVVNEVGERGRLISDPKDTISYAAIRSREISEASIIKEVIEREEADVRNRAEQEQQAKERKTAADNFLASLPKEKEAA